jgi:hypothetical protein
VTDMVNDEVGGKTGTFPTAKAQRSNHPPRQRLEPARVKHAPAVSLTPRLLQIGSPKGCTYTSL